MNDLVFTRKGVKNIWGKNNSDKNITNFRIRNGKVFAQVLKIRKKISRLLPTKERDFYHSQEHERAPGKAQILQFFTQNIANNQKVNKIINAKVQGLNR